MIMSLSKSHLIVKEQEFEPELPAFKAHVLTSDKV